MQEPEKILLQMFHAGIQARIQRLAQTSPQLFLDILEQIYESKATPERLMEFQVLAQQGVFPLPATFKFVSDSDINQAYAAYIPSQGGTVLIQEKLMQSPEILQSIYLEEVGHHIDQVLGGQDTQGDEGFMFRLALEKEDVLDSDELKMGRSIQDHAEIRLSQGAVFQAEMQSLPAHLTKVLLEVTEVLSSKWYQWGLKPEAIQDVMARLKSLNTSERREVISKLFITALEQTHYLLDHLYEDAPQDLPVFFGWLSEDTLLYAPGAIKLFHKRLPYMIQTLVKDLRKTLSYGKGLERVDEVGFLAKIDYINQFPDSQISQLLSKLFDYPEETQAFYDLGIKWQASETILGWLTCLSPQTKQNFMGHVMADTFIEILSGLNRLSETEQQKIIGGFGVEDWASKILLSHLTLLASGHIENMPRLESAFTQLRKKQFPENPLWEVHRTIYKQISRKYAQEILTSLETESHQCHRTGKSQAFKRLKRMQISEPMPLIERLRLAYIID